MSDIPYLLINYASAVPVLLVLIGGSAMAVFRMSHDPARMAKMLSAIGILLLARFALPLLTPMLLNAAPIEQIEIRILLNGLMYSVPISIAYALLFWALLEDRRPRHLGNAGQMPES